MVSAHDFLRWVLPNEGYYCATIARSDTGAKYNKHFTNTESLASFILAQDQLGNTAYYACSSFKSTDNRKGINVQAVKCFWLDVDARTTHANAAYADSWEGAGAVRDFCRTVNFPAPIYVASGGGIYAIWPLDEALEPDRWQTAARQLKQLCNDHGLQADRVRTADLSSILRLPGTHNRKGGVERLVECGPLVGPYSIEQFGTLNESVLRVQSDGRFPAHSGLQRPLDRRVSGPSLVDACLNLYGESDADPNLVSQRCAQLAAVKRNPGSYSEPIIYGAIGVISHCRQGREYALGIFDPEWHTEVKKKLAQQEAFGPTTCAHFESINPKGCEDCPVKGTITSPIQLGRETARIQVEPRHSTLPPDARQEEISLGLPDSFVINESGLCHEKEHKGELTSIQISRHPIQLQSVQTSEVDDHAFSLVFSLALPKGTRTITLPAKVFFSASGISEITGQGAIIHDADLFRKYVRLAVDHWHTNKDVDTRYDQFGWKDEDRAFLFGRRLYTATSVRPVVGSSEIEYRAQYLEPTRSGSLERWSAAANNLFAGGLESQSFGLLCAFAAPLMRFHTRLEGGSIVSFVSDQSGSGKTTTLEAAASVWGRRKGTQLTDTDTKVAQGLKLGIMGNLPATYDEMASKDPEIIRQFVLMFTGGQDKDRGRSDGTLIHTKAEWQTILLLASNKPLVDLLSSSDNSDAPAFRLLEFNADLPVGTDPRKGDQLRRELDLNSGHAGDAFLRILLQPEILSFIRNGIPEWTEQIWRRTNLKSEHRFWVRTVASVIAAGTLVQRYGILDFSVQRITDWICAYIGSLRDSSTVTGVRTEGDVLADFISQNMKHMLVMPHSWRPKTHIPPRVIHKEHLYLRYEQQEGNLYIMENVLRKYLLSRGVHRRAWETKLQDKGVIKGISRRITMGAGTEYASGQSVVYLLDMKHPLMSGTVREVQEKLIDEEDWRNTTPFRKKSHIDRHLKK